MKKFLYTIAFTVLASVTAQAANIEYVFEDLDQDEVFNITVQITGDTSGVTGIASYGGNLEGLATNGIQVAGIDFTQGAITNLSAGFLPQGFSAAPTQGPVGGDGEIFSFGNTQFNGNVVFGIGLDVVDIPRNMVAPESPTNRDILLDPAALVGTINIPGANGLTDELLTSMFKVGGDFFTGSSNTEIGQADSISATVNRIPEPATFGLLSLALVGLAGMRRRS